MTRTALVTGATAGIGAEFAKQLAQKGHDLVLVARDEARLDETCVRLAREFGVRATYVRADLATREGMDLVAARLSDDEAPVDILVNNAGFGLTSKFANSTVEDEQAHLDVLVTAPMRLAHAALGGMLRRKHGEIINVSSVAGFTPRGTYGAHKAWLISFSQWANLEYAADGITVTAVCPGFTRTEFHQRMNASLDGIPRWMWLSADRLVREALADVEKGRGVSIPSKRYKVLAWLSKTLPAKVSARASDRGR